MKYTTNCSECGKFVTIKTAGLYITERSDIDGNIDIIEMMCKKCVLKKELQPEKICPKCNSVYKDYDGIELLCCEYCGYCIHASEEYDEIKKVWKCNYCDRERKGDIDE